jgi:hypothetical protein
MKSERSQVQESDLLADKIEQFVAQIKPYLPAALGVTAVAILGMLGYGFYTSQIETRAARAWTDFYFSDTQSQDLEAISKDFADTSAGPWARLTAGDANMSKAMEKWNLDKNLSDQFFQQAVDDYREVAIRATDSFVKSRALHGLGQALEGLGQRTEALAEYQKITTLTGLGAEFIAEINQRINWLDSKDGKEFFAWYTEKRTNAPASATGGAGLPGLPNLPNFSFPPTGSSPTVPPGAPAAETPAAETPAAEIPAAEIPAAEIPTAAVPAAEPPAAEPAPAPEPAAGTPAGAEPADKP